MVVNQKRVDSTDNYLGRIDLKQDILNYYSGRTVLITGGAVAIGSNLIIVLSRLVGDEDKVIVLDNLSAIRSQDPFNVIPLPKIMFVHGVVREDKDLKRAFKEEPIIEFHLSAFFANQNSIDYSQESAKVDIIGQIKLLENATISKIENLYMLQVDVQFMVHIQSYH